MFRHLIKAVGGLMIVVLLQFIAVPPFASATTGTLPITANTTLTENHFGNIVIAANNITLDCANFSVIGPGASDTAGVGILLNGTTGVTVKNCNVAGFQKGVNLSSGSSSNTFQNDSANSNLFGFFLTSASNNTFDNVTANDISQGFSLISSSGNTITNSVANGNRDIGFAVGSQSNGNVIKNNTANSESIGFFIANSSGNTLANNTGNNDLPGAAFVITGGGTNTVTNNTATNSNVGISVSSSTGNTFSNNTATENFFGFFFSQTGTSGNMVSGNTANDNIKAPNGNGGFGFIITSDVFGNTFTQNTACRNSTVDAFQAIPGSNVFFDNKFCTTRGIP